jgi:two-component system, cell cycle sensor histidine kinase and response regulator CckA
MAVTLGKPPSVPVDASLRRIERRQWWLFSSGIVVTLLLTLGIVSFAAPMLLSAVDSFYSINTKLEVRALVGLVLLFDIYVVFQQLQIHRFRTRLTEREELFRLISENAADMIALVDASGRRLYSSPSYQKLLGYSAEELVETSAYDQIHPDDRDAVVAAITEARKSGAGRRLEYRVRHKDARWLVVESTASVARNHERDERLVIVNRDITDRKQLEEQLYLSQKLEAIGRLSGGVAHDFNNLLGVIIGYSEALQRQIGEDHPHREAVDEIQNAGKRAALLTQQLLAFSRKQVLEPKVLDLNTLVSEVEKMLRRLIGEDIELNIVLPDGLGMVKADRGQIDQVILNLAVNARDAMPNGGKLTLETSNAVLDESDVNRFRYVVPGKYVLLKVTDTGCGMDAELQSHIFEPFFTTKESGKGTGLGLATVYGVIKQSGGYIWVDSELGKGTTFKIYLPRVEEPKEIATPPETPAQDSSRSPRTILLVEDEHSLRKLTRETLVEIGHSVLEASDAFHALDIAERNNFAIDLLLTDVVMPGMSGRVLADKLTAAHPDIRVLYMSGYTDGAVATHGVLESGTSILRKPFTRDELTARVDEVLRSVEKQMVRP